MKPFSRPDQTRRKELVQSVFCIDDTGCCLFLSVAKLSIVVDCCKNCFNALNFSLCNLWKLDCFLPFLLVQFLQPEKFLWVYPTDCLTAKLTGRATTECFDVVKNARSCDLDTRRTGSNIGFQSMIFNLWCTGTNHIGNICLNQLLKMQKVVNFLSCLRIYSWHRLSNGIFGKSWDFVKSRTPSRVRYSNQTK